MNAHRRCLLIYVSASVFLAGCTNTPVSDPLNRERFLQGDAVLACTSIPCSMRWSANRSGLKALYDDQAWDNLASKVAYISYDSNLAYFFLGRAAEELGATGAAKNYFARAQSASRQCETRAFDACLGLNVAEESQRRETRLIALLKAEADATPMRLADAQTRLSQLGLYTAAIDGIKGPRTSTALREFQASQGLPQTGTLGSKTAAALRTLDLPQAEPISVQPNRAEKLPTETANKVNALEDPVPETKVPDLPTAPETIASVSAPPETTIPTNAGTAPTPAELSDAATTRPGTVSGPATAPERSRVKVEVELLSQADPFSEVLLVIKQGTWISVLERGEEWATISHDKQTGYVYTDTLE